MSNDRAKNLPILMNLLGDSDLSVRATAGVSLLLLGKTDVEKRIVAWLKSPDPWRATHRSTNSGELKMAEC